MILALLKICFIEILANKKIYPLFIINIYEIYQQKSFNYLKFSKLKI